MTTTCKVCHRERHIKAAGMCRTCRDKHLSKQMRPIGDAKKRIIELIAHYDNLNHVAVQVGIARNTVVRIQHADIDARIQRSAYTAIMNHQPTGPQAPNRAERHREPFTRADVAEYATTPEGRAFIAKCRAPRPRTRIGVVA